MSQEDIGFIKEIVDDLDDVQKKIYVVLVRLTPETRKILMEHYNKMEYIINDLVTIYRGQGYVGYKLFGDVQSEPLNPTYEQVGGMSQEFEDEKKKIDATILQLINQMSNFYEKYHQVLEQDALDILDGMVDPLNQFVFGFREFDDMTYKESPIEEVTSPFEATKQKLQGRTKQSTEEETKES